MTVRLHGLILVAGALALAQPAQGADLYSPGSWAALASDRAAERVGDSLMVLVYESSQASNTTQIGSKRASRVTAEVATGSGRGDSVNLGMNGSFDGGGLQGRSGKMLAQISVVVDEILSNGDLRVSGAQLLNVGGERTTIRLSGRARRADIYQNTVVSSRLADVQIDYDGSGFVSRSGRPGIVASVFSWLGVF